MSSLAVSKCFVEKFLRHRVYARLPHPAEIWCNNRITVGPKEDVCSIPPSEHASQKNPLLQYIFVYEISRTLKSSNLTKFVVVVIVVVATICCYANLVWYYASLLHHLYDLCITLQSAVEYR